MGSTASVFHSIETGIEFVDVDANKLKEIKVKKSSNNNIVGKSSLKMQLREKAMNNLCSIQFTRVCQFIIGERSEDRERVLREDSTSHIVGSMK